MIFSSNTCLGKLQFTFPISFCFLYVSSAFRCLSEVWFVVVRRNWTAWTHQHVDTFVLLFIFLCHYTGSKCSFLFFFLKHFFSKVEYVALFVSAKFKKCSRSFFCCAPIVLYCACGKRTAIGLSWFPSKHVLWNDWGIKIFYISILFCFFLCQEKRIIVATESTVWIVSACFCSIVAVSTKLVCRQNALYWKASWVSTLLS